MCSRNSCLCNSTSCYHRAQHPLASCLPHPLPLPPATALVLGGGRGVLLHQPKGVWVL